MKIQKLLEDYSKDLHSIRYEPLTIDYYVSYTRRFFRYTNATVFDFENLKKFKEKYQILAQRNITASTLYKYLKCIRKFAEWLNENDYISKNEAKKQRAPLINEPPREVFYQNEIEDIIQTMTEYWSEDRAQYGYSRHWKDVYFLGERNLLILKLLLFGGLRRSEVVKIELRDCTQTSVYLRHTKMRKNRTVYIPKWLGKEIQEYIHKKSPLFYLFEGIHGGPLTPTRINRIFETVRKITGIHIYPHKFRHTYATDCISGGINMNTIQKQLGHSNIRTTSIYLNITDPQREQEIQKLDKKYKSIV